MRLIDADELIAQMQENPPSYDMGGVYDAVRNAPTADEWRDAQKDPPKEGGYYLAVADGQVEKAHFDGNMPRGHKWIAAFMDGHVRVLEMVTHWKLLPEPPEEEEEDA